VSGGQAWTPEECATFLQVSTGQLSQLRRRGGGPPYVKVGRQVRYVPAQVARWIEQTQRTRTRQPAQVVV
jgi:predicted DNA-binding transcriptional regulator AlpA